MQVNKPWLDNECKQARNSYFNFKNKLKRKKKGEPSDKIEEINGENCKAAKEYKRLLWRKMFLYSKSLNDNLRSTKKTNPQEYWKILSGNSGKRNNNMVSLNDFLHLFRNLNVAQDETGALHQTEMVADLVINDEFNAPITVEEVIPMIKKLKNNKACGIDQIRNEFLKHATGKVLEVITIVFNIVLESGIVPHDWCVGLIVPILKNKGLEKDPDNYRG